MGLGDCLDEAAEDFIDVVDGVKEVVKDCPCVEKSKEIVEESSSPTHNDFTYTEGNAVAGASEGKAWVYAEDGGKAFAISEPKED